MNILREQCTPCVCRTSEIGFNILNDTFDNKPADRLREHRVENRDSPVSQHDRTFNEPGGRDFGRVSVGAEAIR